MNLSEKKIIRILSKEGYSFAISETGEFYSWGDNSSHQQCLEDKTYVQTPIINDYFRFTFSLTFPINILNVSGEISFYFI